MSQINTELDVMQETLMTQQENTPTTLATNCPSCKEHTVFTFIGIQTWPPKLVAAANIKPTTTLWRCESCLTTISDVNLQHQS
jgi:hypothetical protein